MVWVGDHLRVKDRFWVSRLGGLSLHGERVNQYPITKVGGRRSHAVMGRAGRSAQATGWKPDARLGVSWCGTEGGTERPRKRTSALQVGVVNRNRHFIPPPSNAQRQPVSEGMIRFANMRFRNCAISNRLRYCFDPTGSVTLSSLSAVTRVLLSGYIHARERLACRACCKSFCPFKIGTLDGPVTRYEWTRHGDAGWLCRAVPAAETLPVVRRGHS